MAAPTGYKDEYAALSGAFLAGWQEGSPLTEITPILWPGIPASIPVDANGEPKSYVRFFVSNEKSTQVSIGAPSANIFRHPGRVVCKVFAKPGLGEVEAKELADKFCAIFRNKILDGFRFSAPYSVIMGQTDDGFYQINCFAPFERDSLL